MVQRTQQVRVTTNPGRAWVWQKDENGKRTVGQSPVVVKTRYQVEQKSLNPWWWAVVGSMGAVTIAGSVFYNDESDAGKYVTYAGSAALGLSLLTWYFLRQYLSGETEPEPQPVVLGASKEGYLDQKLTILVPGADRRATLVLKPDPDNPPVAVPVVAASVSGTDVARLPTRPVVAVFDVEDSSRRIRRGTLDQLTEYLTARLTQVTSYRVVPRAQLRERLGLEKKGTYKKCYDETCQIELGKALAAQKSLATKILRVGKRCAVTATMYDLKSETAERSALTRTDCSADALMDSMDRIARQLSSSDYR